MQARAGRSSDDRHGAAISTPWRGPRAACGVRLRRRRAAPVTSLTRAGTEPARSARRVAVSTGDPPSPGH